ncbi:anaerobic ribonucleoside-triphosphate reductase activating protein [Athalassotoga saccharophila]|uniref:anaerobic ribonucleoside-triphosphate reductase activating protein n=1 Tax=Athalassotoga saccharophila TaxID=1441386 RepID=UPI00137B0030|nr:anaerobic ribonucleoside-triphosphate reductase activating protein [Athalassotoga saccharophila]BBJ28360.1 7-carboxy-7-deazaguanine synthase [Athalassotoga saccharophila]
MNIAAIQKVSFIDYPNKISSVLFCPFCNLRCPYCHNPELVFFKGNYISENEIFAFLEKRKDKIDAVVITGGEPTMQEDLPEFIKKVKNKGFLVKLDTNGHFPNTLEKVVDTVDTIALDLKATCEKYKDLNGDCTKLKQSLNILKNFKGNLIIRTTMYPPLTSDEDLKKMEEIIPKDLKYERRFNEYRDIVTLEKYLKT